MMKFLVIWIGILAGCLGLIACLVLTSGLHNDYTLTLLPFLSNSQPTDSESNVLNWDENETESEDGELLTDVSIGTKFLPDHLQGADQHDPALIEHIRRYWLHPPSTKRLNLDDDNIHYSQFGQSEFIDSILGNQTGGTFLECGAVDGERISNTLFFERVRGWSGLLIEANPVFFEALLRKNRNAYKVNACLSPARTPVVLNFTCAKVLGGLADYLTEGVKENFFQEYRLVQCLPLYSILVAADMVHIDYMSLDIEGAELEVLDTVPYDLVDIGVLQVETKVRLDGGVGNQEATVVKKDTLARRLAPYGYEVLNAPFRIDTVLRKKSKDDAT